MSEELNKKLKDVGIETFTKAVKELFDEDWNEDFAKLVVDYFNKYPNKKLKVAMKQCRNNIQPPISEQRVQVIAKYLGSREFGFKDKTLQQYTSRGGHAAMLTANMEILMLTVWGAIDMEVGKVYEVHYVPSDRGNTLRLIKPQENTKIEFPHDLKYKHIEEWEDGETVCSLLKLNSKLIQNNTGKEKHEFYLTEEQPAESDGSEKKREGLSFKIMAHDEKGDKAMLIIEPGCYSSVGFDEDLIASEDIEDIKALEEKGKVVNPQDGSEIDGNPREQAILSLLAGFEVFVIGNTNISQDGKYVNIQPATVFLADNVGKEFKEIEPRQEEKKAEEPKKDEGAQRKEDVLNVFKMSTAAVDPSLIKNFINPQPSDDELKKILTQLIEEKKIKAEGDKYVKI